MNLTDPPVSSVVELRVGVVSFVIRSELLRPESLEASSTGAAGALGADVSIAMVVFTDTCDTLPALSVWVAVTVPSPTQEEVNVQETDKLDTDSTQLDPLAPSNTTVPPISPTVVPKVGVESLVIRSELLEPESLAVARVGAEGSETTVSTTIVDPGEFDETLLVPS